MGTFEMPDVTIMDGAAVPVAIEAKNVPLGTVVKLHLFAENGPDQIVDSTPLAGTVALSTATASITIPLGLLFRVYCGILLSSETAGVL